jgi:ADP-ribose pyrophosphatase
VEGKEKRNAAKLRWRVRSHKTPFRCEVFEISQDDLEIDGKDKSYAYVVRPEAVVIVPVTDKGDIVVLKQYRYPVDQWCLEVPAGGTHDTGDESLERVARDELREEVGATAGVLTRIGSFYTSPSLTTEKCHVFLGESVCLTNAPERETTEAIKLEVRPAAQVLALAREGKMKTAPCALAVLMCESALRQRGYLGES